MIMITNLFMLSFNPKDPLEAERYNGKERAKQRCRKRRGKAEAN
jgi:hypothetical protein